MAGMIQVPFGDTSINRIEPVAGSEQYKTYGVSMPLSSHWTRATCEEIDCPAFLHGWVTNVDLGTELGQRQHHYITHDRTRSYTEAQAGLLVTFTFPAGTVCFAAGDHKRPLGRPSTFYVRDGDFRGNPRGTETHVHTRVEDWVSDFAEHQDKIATAIERG